MKKMAILALFFLIAPVAIRAQEPDSGVWWPDPTRMVVWSWPKITPPATTETVEAYLYYAYPDGSPMFQFGEADGMEFSLPATELPAGQSSILVEVGGFRWRILNPDQITWRPVYYPVQVMVTEVTVAKFENVTPETVLVLHPAPGSKLIARVRLGEWELHTNPAYTGEYRFRLEEIFPEFPEGETILQVMSGVENPVRARIIRPREPEYRDWR